MATDRAAKSKAIKDAGRAAGHYRDAVSFLRELQAARFDVGAIGNRLIVKPAYCLSREDRWRIARHGAELARLLTATNIERSH